MKTLVIPVIHHLDNQLTLEQADIAKSLGADALFLISHYNKDKELVPLAKQIKKDMDINVGLNLLNTNAFEALDICVANNINMLWLDNAGIHSQNPNQVKIQMLQKNLEQHPNFKLFAGVAFKYQEVEPHPGTAAIMALHHGFIPTTSGEATGKPPTLDKIISMFNKVGPHLAVASGMTPENVIEYKRYLKYILVSTGVSKDEFRFDEAKLKQFIKAVNHN